MGLRPILVALALAILALALACAGNLPAPSAPAGSGPEPAPPMAGEEGASPAPQPPLEPEDAGMEAETPQPPAPETPAAPPDTGALSVGPAAPILLSVGLASDLPSVTLPCCDGEVAADLGGEEVPLASPISVEPAPGVARRAVYRLQVAALRDEDQARELARGLEGSTGEPADAHFDAGVDLYRVRLGRFATRPEAEAARRRLPASQQTSAWVVQEGGSPDNPGFQVTQGGRSWVVAGRWLTVRHSGDGGIRVAGKRYRGEILVFLNDRGSLNLINRLSLEDYLRGVVPRELGPDLYPRLEALKAQAVAARTYTLRNLGEFDAEGYDICGTPRCQVYGGMDAEHPLSDRAVAETAGQVLLYKGELVDALYSSTCGGHTEDVKVMFPDKDLPYLKGVPCMEAGVTRLPGALPAGTPFPDGITRALAPPPAPGDTGPGALEARLESLARLAGLPVPEDRLAGLDRREVQRFVTSVFDLALDARLLVADADLPYLLSNPPADWGPEDRRRAAYLARTGLLDGSLDQPLDHAEVESLLLALAQLLQVVEREEARFTALTDGRLIVRGEGGERAVALPQGVATYRLRGERLVAADLALVPGDRLQLYWRNGARLLGVIQEVDPDGVAFDRASKMSSWRRFRSDAVLAGRVEERFPGLGFTGFEILERGRSGRVGKIRLLGEDGRTAEVTGLAVRWTLDVPDTLFTAKRLSPADGRPGWLFTGRGWGHGVGMCQVGAYGMAGRGATYREILTHYYTGIELALVRREP